MEFKRHPKFRDLRISADGSTFKYLNETLEIKDHKARENNILNVVSIEGIRYSVPKLILETYGPEKPQDGRYYALYKDGNIENIHPNNLFWSKAHKITEKRKFQNSISLSKLSKEQTAQCFERHVIKGESLSSIGKDLGVSATTIARGIKRYKKYLNSLEVAI
ncbi:hypothetical protein SAMN04487764_1528 [Gillisia sp. Hel1_33_143]|uniref:helix-turn-helix domain-containing protein n=1 Tax=Gillisia sp. Hel1_33_143 TaxID=1336796 RepID=UPI00087B9BE0|nr:helix-turn-helix domain-containing protein [Gillisia sp. Hel1_33_143]SDS13294.1 hypothetical protein SAMN04487764_1528 [Gillisia sp. Hel1_33_143]